MLMFFVPTMVWELLARDSIGYIKKMLNNCAYSALIGGGGDLTNKLPEWVTKIEEEKSKDNKNTKQEETEENTPLIVDRILIPNKFYMNMKKRYDNLVEVFPHKDEKSGQLLIQSQMMSQQEHMPQPENLDINEQQQQRQQQHQSIGFFEANPDDQSSTDSNHQERYDESKQQQQQQHKHQFLSQNIHEITKELIEPSKGIDRKLPRIR